MRLYLKVVLFVLLLAVPGYAQDLARLSVPLLGGGVSAAACTTLAAPTDAVTQDGYTSMFNFSTTDWAETAFVSDGSTICGIEVYFSTSTGTDPSYTTITPYIYGDDGTTDCNGAGCPDEANVIATFSNISTVGLGAAGWKAKSTGTAALVNTTRYHLVLWANGADSTNVARWGADNTCTTKGVTQSADGLSWSSGVGTKCFNYKFYK